MGDPRHRRGRPEAPRAPGAVRRQPPSAERQPPSAERHEPPAGRQGPSARHTSPAAVEDALDAAARRSARAAPDGAARPPWPPGPPGSSGSGGPRPDAAGARARVLAGAACAVVAVVACTWAVDALRDAGLVAGEPWVLAVIAVLTVVLATAAAQQRLGSGRLDNRPLLRLVLAFGLFAAGTWTSGWSALLPAAAVLGTIVVLQRSGSRTWPLAVAVAVLFTAAGQLGVHLGLVPSILEPSRSHLAAVWLLGVALLSVATVAGSVAERERSQHELARSDALLQALMDSSTDVLSVCDDAGRLVHVSPAAHRTLGHRADELVGRPLLDLVDPEHRDAAAAHVAEVAAGGPGTRRRADVLVVLASGERRWFEWTLHLLDDPLVDGLVVHQRDVTDRLLASEALAHAASHDDLTRLPNRGELVRRLRAELPEAAPGAGVAVLFIDLDRFKEVNDTHGHATGDELLVVVAQRLAGGLRSHDHLARLGGDEFGAVLTEVTDEAQVRAVAERLADAVARPMTLGGVVVDVSASIGWALAFDGTADPAALFAAADAAMYRVKHARPAPPLAGPPPRAGRPPGDGRGRPAPPGGPRPADA